MSLCLGTSPKHHSACWQKRRAQLCMFPALLYICVFCMVGTSQQGHGGVPVDLPGDVIPVGAPGLQSPAHLATPVHMQASRVAHEWRLLSFEQCLELPWPRAAETWQPPSSQPPVAKLWVSDRLQLNNSDRLHLRVSDRLQLRNSDRLHLRVSDRLQLRVSDEVPAEGL